MYIVNVISTSKESPVINGQWYYDNYQDAVDKSFDLAIGKELDRHLFDEGDSETRQEELKNMIDSDCGVSYEDTHIIISMTDN